MKYLSLITILLFATTTFAQDSEHSDHYSCGITEQTEALFNAFLGVCIIGLINYLIESYIRQFNHLLFLLVGIGY